MADDDQDGIGNLFKDRKLAFLLVIAATASIVITIYHIVSACFSNRHAEIVNPARRHFSTTPNATPGRSAEGISAAELIPSHKYRGEDGADVEEEGICAVCLAEFEDGDTVRTLPGCAHTFHAPCIDMWLFSHATCPVCRADATPSPRGYPAAHLEVIVVDDQYSTRSTA